MFRQKGSHVCAVWQLENVVLSVTPPSSPVPSQTPPFPLLKQLSKWVTSPKLKSPPSQVPQLLWMSKLWIVLLCPVRTESHCVNHPGWPLWQAWYIPAEQVEFWKKCVDALLQKLSRVKYHHDCDLEVVWVCPNESAWWVDYNPLHYTSTYQQRNHLCFFLTSRRADLCYYKSDTKGKIMIHMKRKHKEAN